MNLLSIVGGFSVNDNAIMNYIICAGCVISLLQQHSTSASSEESKYCGYNSAGNVGEMNKADEAPLIFSVDFYVPFNGLNSNETLLIQLTNDFKTFSIKLHDNSNDKEEKLYAKVNAATDQERVLHEDQNGSTDMTDHHYNLNLPLLHYGWNKIYIRASNSSILVLHGNNDTQISLNFDSSQAVKNLHYNITGLFSFVNCYSEWKIFPLTKPSDKAPLVLHNGSATFHLHMNNSADAALLSAIFGDKFMFLCVKDKQLPTFLHLLEKYEEALCKIYGQKSAYTLEAPISSMNKEEPQNIAREFADLYIQNNDTSKPAFVICSPPHDLRTMITHPSEPIKQLQPRKANIPTNNNINSNNGEKSVNSSQMHFLMKINKTCYFIAAISSLLTILVCLICCASVIGYRRTQKRKKMKMLRKDSTCIEKKQEARELKEFGSVRSVVEPDLVDYELENELYEPFEQRSSKKNDCNPPLGNSDLKTFESEDTCEVDYELTNDLYETFQERTLKQNCNTPPWNIQMGPLTPNASYEVDYEVANDLYESFEQRTWKNEPPRAHTGNTEMKSSGSGNISQCDYELPNDLYESFEERTAKNSESTINNCDPNKGTYEAHENESGVYEVNNTLYETLEKRRRKAIDSSFQD